ncbi:peptidylprolyl isomerase [Kordia sp. YSTF-M3]|uniref:Peptidylprolyl isomerase n=2 Tax=Kordia aestuariivivens TaxID=2759037 RepID=A0ABR7QGD0_9FLAO|nr:peptidylprolyl isomerase [Kordia aestuariivivens]
MQLSKNSLKLTINTMKQSIYVLVLLVAFGMQAQEKEDATMVSETIMEAKTQTKDSTKSTSKRIKIDGVAAVVGDYIILESDIDKTFLDFQQQGVSMEGLTRCKLLGKLMEDKLYAHQAIQDSIEVSPGEIRDRVNQNIEYFSQQTNGMAELLKFYAMEDEATLRERLTEITKVQFLTNRMQSKVVRDVEITPEEVRQFFEKIPVDQRPVIGVELEVAQIIIAPEPSKEAVDKVIDKLKGIKAEVEAGSSFGTKAILYSKDRASGRQGGLMAINKRMSLAKEFKDVAFSLQQGEISDPFETEFGWHIVMIDKVRGQERDVRHILLIPEITNEKLEEARKEIDTLRQRIMAGELTFDEAARSFSDDKETRNNGGKLINPATYDTHFELTKMDPEQYSQIEPLKGNEISIPLIDETRTGQKRFKLLKVTNRYNEHVADYSKDYIKIKSLALKEKQLKEVGKWITQKIEDTYINVNSDNRKCEFTNNWLKK